MATGTMQQMFVGGDWRPSLSHETFDAISPATGEVIGAVPQGDREDARRAIAAARTAAEDAKRLGGEAPNSFSAGKRVMLMRRPRGVVGVISPWNWPYTMPAELIAPALASGNTIVWAPAPSTSVCAVALARCIAEA